MAKDENRGAREEGKNGRRGTAEAAEAAPLVSSKRGKFETLANAKIEAPVFGRFADYKAFVAEVEGDEPEDGAIISAGLEMLFEADKGFERWLAERRKRERSGSSGSASAATAENGNGSKKSAPVAAATNTTSAGG